MSMIILPEGDPGPRTIKGLIVFCAPFIVGLFIYGWYFYIPPDKPPCEEGWSIVRRFGFDFFLGDIPVEEARKQAGGNVLKWSKHVTAECDPYKKQDNQR